MHIKGFHSKRGAKRLMATAATVMLLVGAQAQSDDPVVMTIGKNAIHRSEFMRDFNASAMPGRSGNEREAMREYAELYSIFRARVEEARAMGIDTMRALEKELSGYRDELAAPYLVDSAAIERLMQEAYERNHYYLRAAHILVPVSSNASPADTLKAYNHIMELRKRILNGEDFFAVSREEVGNQREHDERMPVREDEGELGYFTAFNMVYPFETAAYALNPGELSMPVRSQFGYHIIKLFDRQAIGGKVQVAHIWQREGKSEDIINEIYTNLQNGESFEKMARRSDDNTTSDKGGVMPELNLNQLLPEYIAALNGLKVGDYSKPFHTKFGWHIVKLVKMSELPSLDELRPRYKQYMARDARLNISRKSFANTCRAKYGAVDYTLTPVKSKSKRWQKEPLQMMASLDGLVQILNDTVFKAKWYYEPEKLTDTTPMAMVDGKVYTISDVARYVYDVQKYRAPMPLDMFARQMFDDFVDSMAVACQKRDLEKEYPEFAEVVEDYRRGLMIFSYNDRMVWSKAATDSAGYQAFYDRESVKKSLNNPTDSIYFWNVRARVLNITVPDSACLAPAKAVKLAKKAAKKNLTSSDIRKLFQSNYNKGYKDASATTMLNLIEKGSQGAMPEEEWQKGVYVHPLPKGYTVLIVQEIIEPMLKSSIEARGYYLSAYQNEIEAELNAELREKYNIKINWDEIEKIRL